MTTLTETQARALLDFALTQVQHLLPDPLPQNLKHALQNLHPASRAFAGPRTMPCPSSKPNGDKRQT